MQMMHGNVTYPAHLLDGQSPTSRYDEPEVENVARGCSPSATFSTEGHHIECRTNETFFICFVVWPITGLKYDFLVNF